MDFYINSEKLEQCFNGSKDLMAMDTLTTSKLEGLLDQNMHIRSIAKCNEFFSQPLASLYTDSEKMDLKKTFSGELQRENAFHRFQTRHRGFTFISKELPIFQGSDEESDDLPVGRYYDALEGPELEVLKDSEDILLPMDETWPFLLRFPISTFGIALGLGSQTVLWKTLASNPSLAFLHISPKINLILWILALITYSIILIIYALKVLVYFEAVRCEYFHPVRVNYFFAPWISAMFLAIGIPPSISETIHPITWCMCMGPLFILELKIYGQWLSSGKRRLSKVANPSTHMSVVGNFVGAILGALVGWKELALFFWAIGVAHYLVVFVTLYQRLPTNEALTKDLQPVFFLFVAAPSSASIGWEAIAGDFDYVSKVTYLVALFLLLLLVVRINLFCGIRFSIAWWAYTFPLAAASCSTIHYSRKIPNSITQGLAVVLSLISTAVVIALFISTVFHAFVWKTLFPNDMAIAIMKTKQKKKKKDTKHSVGFQPSICI